MRFLKYIFCALLFVTASVADTININWMNGDETYAQTTCEIGGDLILPESPIKRGYTFKGWLAGYTRLEYIESTGTQWLDTGYVLTGDEILEFEAQFTGTVQSLDYDSFFTGCQQSDTDKGGFWVEKYIRTDGKWQWYVRYNSLTSVYTTSTKAGLNRRYELSIGPRSFKVDGAKVLIPADSGTHQDTSITIFGRKNSNGAIVPGIWKCWSYKIIKNNNVVKSYVPAKRNSDSVIGMYDTVSNTFFTNAGTGEFIAGPVAGNQNFYE